MKEAVSSLAPLRLLAVKQHESIDNGMGSGKAHCHWGLEVLCNQANSAEFWVTRSTLQKMTFTKRMSVCFKFRDYMERISQRTTLLENLHQSNRLTWFHEFQGRHSHYPASRVLVLGDTQKGDVDFQVAILY